MERVQGMKTLVMARISVQMAQMKILATAVSHLVPFAHNAVDYSTSVNKSSLCYPDEIGIEFIHQSSIIVVFLCHSDMFKSATHHYIRYLMLIPTFECAMI